MSVREFTLRRIFEAFQAAAAQSALLMVQTTRRDARCSVSVGAEVTAAADLL
jgi:hypothetical protein